MNSNLRKTIVAGSITALISFPVWAAPDAPKDRSDTPANSVQQPMGQGGNAASGANSQPGAAASTGAGARASANNPLHARTADDVEDMDVVNAAGDKIASIDGIVMTTDGAQAHAVIKVGGVMGVGGRTVLVSLDELAPVAEDKLRIDASEEELKARPEYDKEQYVELDGDRLIGDSVTQSGGGRM